MRCRERLLRMACHRIAQELEDAAPPQKIAGLLVPLLRTGGEHRKHPANVDGQVVPVAVSAQRRAQALSPARLPSVRVARP